MGTYPDKSSRAKRIELVAELGAYFVLGATLTLFTLGVLALWGWVF